jgi:hypothetical protein
VKRKRIDSSRIKLALEKPSAIHLIRDRKEYNKTAIANGIMVYTCEELKIIECEKGVYPTPIICRHKNSQTD